MAQARSVRAINHKGKKWGSITYSTGQEDEVSKDIYYISIVCLMGSGMICIHEEQLQISEAGRFAKLVNLKSHTLFSTQFRVKESSKLLLSI